MPADQARSFHKKSTWGRAAPCRAGQRGADEPERRKSAAATMAWRTVRMSDDLSLRKRAECGAFFSNFKVFFGPRTLRGTPKKGKRTSDAYPRPIRPLRTHVALLLRSRASATFPVEPQRPQGPLCGRTLLTRSFVIAPARLLVGTKSTVRARDGPSQSPCSGPAMAPPALAPGARAACRGTRKAALSRTDRGARFMGLLKSTARASRMYRLLLSLEF